MVIYGGMKVWRWAPDDRPIAVPVGELKGVGGSNDGPLWLEIREAATSTAIPSIGEAIDDMALADYEPGMLESIQTHDIPVEQTGAVALRWRRSAAGNLGVVRRLVAYTLSTDAENQTVYSGRIAFLCGANWLITSADLERQVWPSGPSGGGIDRDALLAYAQQNWLPSFGAGDLANLILRAVVGSWPPVLAKVEERLQSLTKSFLDGLEDRRSYDPINDRKYAAGLLEVQRIVHGMSSRLAPLARPAANLSDAWFRGKHTTDVAAAVKQLVEHSAQILASQQEQIRASFALIAATQTSEQLKQTNEQLALARETQRLALTAETQTSEQLKQTNEQLALARETQRLALTAETQTSEQLKQTNEQLALARKTQRLALTAETQTSEQLTQTNEQISLARDAQGLAEKARTQSEEVQASIDFLGTVLVGPGLVAAFSPLCRERLTVSRQGGRASL